MHIRRRITPNVSQTRLTGLTFIMLVSLQLPFLAACKLTQHDRIYSSA